MKHSKKSRTKKLAVMSVLMLLVAAFAVQSAIGDICYCAIDCPTWDNCTWAGTKCPPGQPAIGGVVEDGVNSLDGACQLKFFGAFNICITPTLTRCGTRAMPEAISDCS